MELLLVDVKAGKVHNPWVHPAQGSRKAVLTEFTVHNQIAFQRKPEDLILDPFSDDGFATLTEPAFLWRPLDRAPISGFAASSHSEINAKIDSFLAVTARNKVFAKAFEFNTFPVLLEDVWFKKSFVTVKDKCLISGAAGIRLLNQYCWENGETDPAVEQKLAGYFTACQQAEPRVLPVLDRPLPRDTAFAVECRNTFNYYHFVTETLCQLCLVEEAGVEGPIFLHYPNHDDKTRPFARGFIAALFPELLDRVQFQRAPVRHEAVVAPYNFQSSVYQMGSAEVGLIELAAPKTVAWKGRLGTRASHGVLAMNSVDGSLLKLRARALRAIEGKDFSHLPKRFWVSRGTDQARSRVMRGEDDILDMLKLFGFQQVVFENLSPLEQVAIMANAEMMVSSHGAGFTNMLFAGPQTYVVELGTLQTAMYRWGDFWRLANAAGCRYVTFFADFDAADPLKEPAFLTDGIVPVHLGWAGLARVMAFVVAVLGHTPKFARPSEVQVLGEQLMAVGAHDKARTLFETHAGLERGHVGLSLAMAECHEHFQQRFAQLAGLHSAYGADPSSWGILIRIIWCAKAMNNTETMRAALLALQDGFPDRFAAFVKGRIWAQKHASDGIESEAT
jgi:capsular polysaccharide biosynthesis protein